MLSPEEVNYFANSRTRARSQTGRGLARNAFAQGQVRMRSDMARQNLARQYAPARDQIQQNAAVRGLSSSGFYRRGLRDLLADRMRGLQDIELGETGSLGDLRFQQQDLEAGLADSLGAIDDQELVRRILAAQIRGAQ